MKSLLITFGCSWTYGIGLSWHPGMSAEEFESSRWSPEICDRLSFRGILARRYDLDALNFSMGGSSNQTQFRLAREYFGSLLHEQHKQQYEKILVLWGITSTARNEVYHADSQLRRSFMYNNETALSKIMITDHYDHAHEVEQLAKEILFWNKFFSSNGVDNIWFDTFNHHDYPEDEKIQQDYESVAGDSWPTWQDYVFNPDKIDPAIMLEINNVDRWNFALHRSVAGRFLHATQQPRDLASRLAADHGWNNGTDRYHMSDWVVDSDRIKILYEHELVNPVSLHPTQQGHKLISEMFVPWFDQVL
jgi:hypothetical protein